MQTLGRLPSPLSFHSDIEIAARAARVLIVVVVVVVVVVARRLEMMGWILHGTSHFLSLSLFHCEKVWGGPDPLRH